MLKLNQVFRKNILDNFHEQGSTWLDALPGLVEHYANRWSLEVLEPYLLSYSYCAPVCRADGSPAVLKLAIPSSDFTLQVLATQFFEGHGMPRLLEADIDQGVILMEQLSPGKMLADEVNEDEEATRIAAAVMQRMWVTAPSQYPFDTLSDWAQDFEKVRTHFKDQDCPLPYSTIDRTTCLFKELLKAPGPQYLLHGDLHHFNILSAAPDSLGWRPIDPFGIVGECEFEIGAFMRNPNLELPIIPSMEDRLKRRIDIFHDILGFDRQRMAAWASVYAAVSAWWVLSSGADGWQKDAVLSDLFARF